MLIFKKNKPTTYLTLFAVLLLGVIYKSGPTLSHPVLETFSPVGTVHAGDGDGGGDGGADAGCGAGDAGAGGCDGADGYSGDGYYGAVQINFN